MTAEEAARVFAEIAVRTNGWDNPSSEAWMRDIQHLHHYDLATNAARQLVDSHTDYGRPPWGAYLGIYRVQLARHITEQNALPEPHAWLQPAEYMHRLTERAEAGLQSYRTPRHDDATISAAAELDHWRRLAHTGVPSLDPRDWHHALINTTEEL